MAYKRQLSLHKLSLPIFIEMTLRNSTVLINTYMVSVYSNHLVPALGAGNEIFELVVIVFTFITMATSVVLAQAIGAKKLDLSDKIIHQSLLLILCAGLIFSIFIFINASFLLRLLNIPLDLMQASLIYLKLLTFSLFIDALCMVLVAILRVFNFAYFTMAASFSMDVVTIIANYYILNYTDYGIFGVGCAILLGRLINFIILVGTYYFKMKIPFVFKKLLHFNKEILKKLSGVGMFSGGEYFAWGTQHIIAFSFVGSLGAVALGVHTIFVQITILMMITGVAISLANEIIVGKLIGARRIELAYKHTWRALLACVLASLFVACMVFLLQDKIMKAFNLNDEYKEMMRPLFALALILEFCRTFNILMVNALKAAGDVRFPFYTGCIFMLGLSLPLGYALCFHYKLGVLGIWLGFLADEAARAIIHTYRWKSRKWEGKFLV